MKGEEEAEMRKGKEEESGGGQKNQWREDSRSKEDQKVVEIKGSILGNVKYTTTKEQRRNEGT